MKKTDSAQSQSISSTILQATSDILSHQFQTRIVIQSVIILSEPPRRNLVARIMLYNAFKGMQGIPGSIILKQSTLEKSAKDDKEALGRFSRDWAGLEFLSDVKTLTSIAPKFYGGSTELRFVLIEDLGNVHTSLVDPLMAQDRNAAKAALNRYMNVMAALHGGAHSAFQNHHAIIQRLNPAALIWQDDFDDMFAKIANLLQKFHILLNAALKNEITHVFNLAKDLGPFTTLMHGDLGPDNVFDDSAQDKMRIIDFEWSFVGNALLDAVGLRMCMPTSWCVKAFPEDVIESFERIYRNELTKYIPAASNDAVYYKHYVAACAYWMLWRVVSLNDILEADIDMHHPKFPLHPMWKPEYNLRRPRNLYRFEVYIETAEKYGVFPHLKKMAESILKELKIRWPETEPLKLYPAFADK